MTTATEAIAPPRAGMGAGVVTLLAVAVFINYLDRGNLATAAPLLKDELHLTASQLGLLFSAFFWTYIPSQILAGWLAERINAYRTLALGVAVWALATAATGLAMGFAVLITLRLILGLGESAIFPCSSKLIARHLPLHKLGVANGAIATGLALGPAFGTFAGGMLMAQFGWRTIFLLFGVASLLWLVPWFGVTREAALRDKNVAHGDEPSFRAFLVRRELWGACIGHFTSNYAFYFVITWLPLYLVKSRGFTVPEMAKLAGVIYLVYAASAQISGWAADHWMRCGASANRVRKTLIVAGQLGVAAAMLGCAFGDARVCIASLLLAGLSFGPGTANVYAIGQTLAGPRAAGKWVSIQNCIGNVSGVVAPLITGFVIDRTGDFFWAFAVACAITLVGVIAWGVIIPRVAPLAWPQHT
jgi:MFS family permease